ncbi:MULTISPECIES: hypothetical protein [Stenotrophomonas]|jgi:hypothetical protein|uniref:hypothetical protein n=1 Tax=Stenotrophomonas TaxID=40323 RepID=UPI000CF6F063|nr:MULTISPECIES: hypothetical protein [Stenotrophomonas]AVJ31901.1 hypothetical protein CLM74_03420 [Stenotrophomonas sp. MYb57]MCK6232853.1 hypothetical protein [Stenotrophomonas indicatrix]NYT99633.1 hypothetical protein [Stenotrophomonas sp. SbOxS2]QBR43158.1 hypothetical protein DAIF1_06850 [Stenotrophomonas indicatrix]QZN82583.1 hypothetical protein K5K93_09390 [Stenotrophomonas sp. DR822]
MATHKVHFTLPSRELGKADVSFAVRKDDDKFGELKVSNGSAVWFRADGKKGYRLSWSKLDALFAEHGNKVEKR